MHYPPGVRAAAIKAYYAAGGNMAAAVRLFNEQCPDNGVANPFDFIKYWVAMFDQRFSVLDAPAHGPTPRLDNDLAAVCITLLLSGYKTEKNQQRYFRSIAEAVQRSEQLRDIMASVGIIHPAALLRTLKARDPSIRRRRQHYSFSYTAANMHERLLYCHMMLWLSAAQMMQLLSRVIWIDAKKLWVGPKDELVYAPRHADMYIEHPHARNGKKKSICIHYYIAVSAVLGPILFLPVTGTTELLKLGGRLYKVGGSCYACCAWLGSAVISI